MNIRLGRRRGPSGTRDAILEAARFAFAEKGFDATTVRDIAAMAGVDPAMINHHFGTKEKLFLATVDAPLDPREHIDGVLDGAPDTMGARLLETMLTIWDSPVGVGGIALLRTGIQHDWGAKLLREFLLNRLLSPIVAALPIDEREARWRVNLLASQVAGLILTRYVLKLEPLASAPRAEVVAAIAPTLQRYLTGPVDLPK